MRRYDYFVVKYANNDSIRVESEETLHERLAKAEPGTKWQKRTAWYEGEKLVRIMPASVMHTVI